MTRRSTSSVQVLAFELGTRIGLPEVEGQRFGRAFASIFDAMPVSISQFKNLDDPLVVVPELLKSLALQVVQLLTMAPSVVAQVVGQVIAVAVWLGRCSPVSSRSPPTQQAHGSPIDSRGLTSAPPIITACLFAPEPAGFS